MRRQFKQVLGIPKLSVSGCNCEPLIYFWTNLKPLSSITIIACKTHKLDHHPTPSSLIDAKFKVSLSKALVFPTHKIHPGRRSFLTKLDVMTRVERNARNLSRCVESNSSRKREIKKENSGAWG